MLFLLYVQMCELNKDAHLAVSYSDIMKSLIRISGRIYGKIQISPRTKVK